MINMRYSLVMLLILTSCFFLPNVSRAQRQESLKSWEIAFGATIPASRAYPNKDALYSFGVGYAWDIDEAFVEVRGDYYDRFSGNPTQRYMAATFGGNYIVIDEELWALFGGLNLGLGFAKIQAIDSKGGFHIGGDVGALFLRNSDVNLDFRLRLIYNTADLLDSHPFFFGFIAGLHF